MIKLQFVTASGFFDKLIKIYSHGDWPAHVDAVLADGCLLGAQGWQFGSVPTGVQIRPANYETFAKTRIVTLDATPPEEAAFWTFLSAQIGKPYNWPAILGLGLCRRLNAPDAWYCSELIAQALIACGWWPKLPSLPVTKITPSGLLLAVSPFDTTA